ALHFCRFLNIGGAAIDSAASGVGAELAWVRSAADQKSGFLGAAGSSFFGGGTSFAGVSSFVFGSSAAGGAIGAAEVAAGAGASGLGGIGSGSARISSTCDSI